jgi:hypothetical protein
MKTFGTNFNLKFKISILIEEIRMGKKLTRFNKTERENASH